MLTKKGSPLAITITFSQNEFHHKVKIDLKLLEALTKDTDTILFIDLIKRMIQEVPDQRENCEDLIEHAALMNNEERLEIVQHLAEKCFNRNKCINEYLVKVMDKKEVHMEGSMGENSDEWKKFFTETAKYPDSPDIKKCSSLLMIFDNWVILSNERHLLITNLFVCSNFIIYFLFICS